MNILMGRIRKTFPGAGYTYGKSVLYMKIPRKGRKKSDGKIIRNDKNTKAITIGQGEKPMA